jgi:hypothetical protein
MFRFVDCQVASEIPKESSALILGVKQGQPRGFVS